MIFYKSKEELVNQLNVNKEELETRRAYYEQRKKESLEKLQNINEQIQNESDYEKVNSLIVTLYQYKESIENLRLEKKNVCKLLDNICTLEKDIDNFETPEYKEKIDEFNKLHKNTKKIDEIKEIEEDKETEKEAIENLKNGEEDAKKGIEIIEDVAEEVKEEKEEIDTENVLLISEMKDKVILPYTKEELQFILNDPDNGYKDIQEIIDAEYSIPLKEYKNFYSARFREAYNLIKKKERRGAFEALDIAFEMASNRKLHPAVITACENLDQLDIYLDCLEENRINDFKFFKVKFESYPIKPV